jgi:hypothetical protein
MSIIDITSEDELGLKVAETSIGEVLIATMFSADDQESKKLAEELLNVLTANQQKRIENGFTKATVVHAVAQLLFSLIYQAEKEEKSKQFPKRGERKRPRCSDAPDIKWS